MATPVFRALWIATIVSNIGTWMNDVGSSWLMTTLSPSPLWVAMVQAATTLPVFLLALPSGALADVVDRRKLLIASQTLIVIGATTLALTTGFGLATPLRLLTLTAVMGVGAALSAPVFQAIVPELVDRSVLADAVTLNSLGVNIARAVGPALGGVIVAAAGPAAVFGLNAISVLAVLAVLAAWKRQPASADLPPEHFFGALRAGYRYARHAPGLQRVLLRSIAFFLFSSALWALLPLIARRSLGLDAAGYGVLLGAMGAGAVLGALIMKRLRAFIGVNRLSIGASILFAGATLAMAVVNSVILAWALMAAAGMAWITMLTALNVAAQLTVPAWVKARALAVYLVVFQGAMTAGSLTWGALATWTAIETALLVSGVLLLIVTVIGVRLGLPDTEAIDLTPSGHWAAPGSQAADRGPVMILIEYRIDPGQIDAFHHALRRLRPLRLRDGAFRWDVFQDGEDPGLVVEAFQVPSWLEHLRQHERVTRDDRLTQDEIRRLHLGDAPPKVRHLIAPAPKAPKRSPTRHAKA